MSASPPHSTACFSFLALKDTLFAGHVLRSADPSGLEQELWALLTLYQILCRNMVDAVESRPGTDPDRASFTIALHAAAEQVMTAQGILGPADDVGEIGRSALAALHPTRRPRTSARKAKRPMSQYNGSPSGKRPRASHRIATTGITVLPHPADPGEPAARDREPGFRELTLRLLRTDPDRAWRTVEISRALGITVTSKYRSLCTQINR